MRAECAGRRGLPVRMLLLLVAVLLSASAATAESIAPQHGVFEADTTFVIEVVQFPYTTCKTVFNGEEGQAVFASIVNDTDLGIAKALCVLRAPFQDEEHTSVEAIIEVSQASGPRSEPEKFSSFKVYFSQAPVVASGAMQYSSGQRFGSVIVQITHIDGILRGGEALRELLRLSLDLSVLQRSVLRLSLESFQQEGEVAYLVFVLPDFLPSGQYPCFLTINDNPLPLAAPEAPTTASTRTAEQFNASDTAQAAPLLPPAKEHTFLITVELPIVRLMPQSVELKNLPCGLEDYDTTDYGSTVSEHRPLAAAEGEVLLSLELEGLVYSEAAALLLMFPADLPIYNVSEAVRLFEFDWSRQWESAVIEDRIELRVPTETEPVTLQWVRWDTEVVSDRVITFREEEEDALSDREFVVRVADTVGAVAGPQNRSAFVASANTLLMAVPEFSVGGKQVLHRSGDLQFELLRSGAASHLQSVVQWRIVYLDPLVPEGQDEPVLPGTLPTPLDVSHFAHPPSNISAVFNSTGTVSWPAQSLDLTKPVTVPIDWGAVPYAARWMMVVQLSILFNGQLANDVFTILTLPPPRLQPSTTSLDDQLAVLSPVVSGSTTSLATSTNAILYGVEEGSCPPGTGRTLGTAKGVPVQELLVSASVHSMALQLRHADSDADSDTSDDAFFWMPSLPLFNSSTHSYDLTIPFGYNNASIVLATSEVGYYVLDGCGSENAEPLTAPLSRWSLVSPIETDEKGSTGGKLRQLFWPVLQPEASRCTADVHVCSSDTGPENCAAGTARSTYEATVTWLKDPMLAVIDAVNVTVGDQAAVRVCSSDEEHALEEHTCPEDSLVRPGANSNHPLCAVVECVPHSLVGAGLTYTSGEQIQIAVEPVYAESVRSVSIGQRVFRAQSGSSMAHVAVSFTLFDISDRLSPFVPFFIRWRSKDRTLLDVPITLTLIDGRTSAPLNLLLDIDVQQPPPPPPPQTNITSPKAGAAEKKSDSAAAPADSLSPSGAPMEVSTEGTTVTVVDSNSTSEQAPQPGALVVAADDVSDMGPDGRRRLHDVSSSAPHDQQWLSDPLQNSECSACAEGMFSDSVDSLCRQCQPGTCAPRQGMAECAVCPPGTYSAVHGASSCSPCVHGSYSQLPGSGACRLCPFGYTTVSDGASICDQALEQTVAIGKQYALAISLAMRLSGADLEDVAKRTGVLGPSEDILRFLVSLDSADAFGVSTRDVEVVSIEQVKPQELRVLLTTNIGIDVPPNANRQQLDHAIDVAQLSKDAGISNLTWTHTTEALGTRAVTENFVKTEVREPDPRKRIKWEAIVLPIVAGVVIIGSALMLKIRSSRDNGPIEAVAQTPHLLFSRVLVAFRAPVQSIFRDHSHMSDVSSDIGIDCDDLEVDVHSLRPNRTIGKRGSTHLTEMSVWTSEDARKRSEMSRDIEL